jgi:outer membrane immunogenic protein
MRNLVLGAAVLAALVTPVSAADLPVKAPPPVAAIVYSWTGFYIGASAGWIRQRDAGDSNFFQVGAAPNNPQSHSVSDSSFIAGAHAGYNWQLNRLLLGLEGDWNWVNTRNSFCRQTDIFSAPCTDNTRGFVTLSSETDWIATLRGRLGYTWDRFLVYGTGGAALGKVDTTVNVSCLVAGCGVSPTPLTSSGSFSNTKAGWVAGGGVELMLAANWTARAEYLHVDLGTVTNTHNIVGGLVVAQSVTWSRRVTYDTVRGALSYKFGAAP